MSSGEMTEYTVAKLKVIAPPPTGENKKNAA